MIEMNLVGVRVELPGNQPIVLLKEREGERYLPIWIGTSEATAIAFALQGVVTARPMTHDLMKNILEELGVQVARILITELREGTFYAVIEMAQNGSSFEITTTVSSGGILLSWTTRRQTSRAGSSAVSGRAHSRSRCRSRSAMMRSHNIGGEVATCGVGATPMPASWSTPRARSSR